MNRRQFLQFTGAAGLAAGLPVPAQQSAARPIEASDRRPLGGTGVVTTALGMGTGVTAWNGVSKMTKKGRDAFVGLIKHAADRGLGYLDLADMYGAHDYVKEALGNGVDRGETMLLTKTVARQPDLIRADIERFRHELGTDYLDVVLLHCLTEDDWPTRYAGCLDELARAKDKGLIRAHGVSCHDLGALKQAAVSEWVDVILARVNPAGVKMDGPVEEVVPVLKQAKGTGKGLIGMKIVGEGRLGDRIPESLRFAFREVGVDAVTIGFETPRQIDEAAEHLRTATA